MKGMGGKLFYCKFVTSSTLAKKQKKNQVESCPLSKIKLEFVDFVHALAPPLVQPHLTPERYNILNYYRSTAKEDSKDIKF